MNRQALLARIREHKHPWDIAVIGGGASGVGVALDAASRGYSVVLFEQDDFGKGTSSRSTKLVHGGVRYLQQGHVRLVREALRERSLLLRNAPHCVHDLPLVVPTYRWWEGPFYGIGLHLYDLMAGQNEFGSSRTLTRHQTLARIPNLNARNLRGGVLYHDGQFDDARLLIQLVRTAIDHGAILVNHAPVLRLVRSEKGPVTGLIAQDRETGEEIPVSARAIVNATGPFCDAIRRMADPQATPLVTPSQGIHLVLPGKFLAGDSALLIPHTADGRVLFVIPWHGRALLGTTDTPLGSTPLEPRITEDEIDFLLSTAAAYLRKAPTRADVLSAFAGIRPLVAPPGGSSTRTSSISRNHHLERTAHGMITLVGGKWTTYRQMAQDCVDQAAQLVGLPHKPCITRHLRVHGYHPNPKSLGTWATYGSDASALEALVKANPVLGQELHHELPYRVAEVIWAARWEMARTVEDVLARRTRALFLNARAALTLAPRVAQLLALELQRDKHWQTEQVQHFTKVARGYLIESACTGELTLSQ